MKVDFFVAGVQKAGTTALDQCFRVHPSIQMASVKEVHYFDNERVNWSNPDYSELHSKFDWDAPCIRGEATPIYTYWPNALERLKAYNAGAKIIVALRHPSYRAHSHWRMERKRGLEPLSFSEAIRWPARKRVINAPNGAHRIHSYIERGFYLPQVERLMSLFPPYQLHFFRTDCLWREPDASLNRILAFLEVDQSSSWRPSYIVPELTWQSERIDNQDMTYLNDLFADDIKLTAARIGISLDDWLDLEYVEPMRPH